MKLIVFICLAGCAFAADTDIFARTVNFVLFAIILVFLTLKHIKNMLNNRKKAIEDNLFEAECKLNEMLALREQTIAELAEAKEQAEKVLEVANQQAQMMRKNILQEAKTECEHLDKHLADRCQFEQRRAKIDVINEIVDEAVVSKVNFSNEEILELIDKKAG